MMDVSVRIFAPAKINVGLRVLGKKEGDTYHGIESIFQTVGLCDEIEVGLVPGRGQCSVSCDAMSLPEDNTITRTYRSFVGLTGCGDSVSVSIKKRIPAGGGLGGGSSDAASFLRALADLNGISLDSVLSDAVAGDVGSDVFFFLGLRSGFGAALVSGRGEVVREIRARDLHVVLVLPDVFSSTKEAYSLLDREYGEEGDVGGYIDFESYEDEYNGAVRGWRFRNSFTRVLSAVHPEIGEAVGALLESGAEFADMSGSGSSVFGVFSSRETASSAASALGRRWRCVLA